MMTYCGKHGQPMMTACDGCLKERDALIQELEQFKNAAPQALIELVEQRDHWRKVAKDCSDNYHAMRAEIEAAAETSRKLQFTQERLAEAEWLLRLFTWYELYPDDTVVCTSAQHGETINEAKQYFAKHSKGERS